MDSTGHCLSWPLALAGNLDNLAQTCTRCLCTRSSKLKTRNSKLEAKPTIPWTRLQCTCQPLETIAAIVCVFNISSPLKDIASFADRINIRKLKKKSMTSSTSLVVSQTAVHNVLHIIAVWSMDCWNLPQTDFLFVVRNIFHIYLTFKWSVSFR